MTKEKARKCPDCDGPTVSSMTRHIQVTFDAHDPHALAAWWSALIGYQVEDGHDFIAGILEKGAVTESDVIRIDGRWFFDDAVAKDLDCAGNRAGVVVHQHGPVRVEMVLDVPQPLFETTGAANVARGGDHPQARIGFGGKPGPGAIAGGIVYNDQIIHRLCQQALHGTAQLVKAVVRDDQGCDAWLNGLRARHN